MTKHLNGTIILLTAWVGFILCLILPASYTSQGVPESGWYYAISSLTFVDKFWASPRDFYFAIPSVGNLLILVSPSLIFYSKPRMHISCALALMGFGLLAASFYFYTDGDLNGIGFILWVISFFIGGIGLLAMYKQFAHNNQIHPMQKPRG